MNVRYFHILKYIAGLTLLVSSWTVNATLITNGTFDTDLSGWDTTFDATTNVTWVSGKAHVGAPGTPGTSTLSQIFSIAAGTTTVSIDFDYLWQVNPPILLDTFTAMFSYESTSGTVSQNLLVETSAAGSFGSVTSFSGLVGISNLNNIPSNGFISFSLNEQNATRGTRIELDNVVVQAVPEPATVALFGLGLLGLGFARHRKASA